MRISTVLSLALAVGAGFLLFQTSQNVQQAESRLHKVQSSLAKEQDALRVLEAEWDYLNRPDRLEELARQYLKMEAQSPASLVRDSSDLPQPNAPVIPSRKPLRNIQSAVMEVEAPVGDDAPAIIESVISRGVPEGGADLPMPAPVTNDTRQQFDDLLNNLTRQEPSNGGGTP